MSNIISAIINLVQNPKVELIRHYKANNRANNMGDALEEYIKDLFANTVEETDENVRLEKIQDVFSYLGNPSNPPDSMLRGGDAIEVKKLEGINVLELNSSHPKQKLRNDNPKINQHCKDCEEWEERDMLYVVGICKQEKVKSLCMVYGDEYCADIETYSRIEDTIRNDLYSIGNAEFTTTKELGRLNRVDPLGITNLRIRGMWTISNPLKVFDYIYTIDKSKKFNFMALINNQKYAMLEGTEELEDLLETIPTLSISDVRVKNPNNPAQLKDCKMITYKI